MAEVRLCQYFTIYELHLIIRIFVYVKMLIRFVFKSRLTALSLRLFVNRQRNVVLAHASLSYMAI